jgi:pimeloyl-ACP methyl ester carboxylesterase
MERIEIDVSGAVSVIDHGGSGPLVVCIHGLEGSAYNWNPIGPALARNHRVVAPDLSGFGYTPPLERGSSIDANAEVVAGVIRHFGEDAILIGNSMGGLLALLVADRHPDLVRAIVLIDPAVSVSRWARIRPLTAARLALPLVPWLGPGLIRRYRSMQTPDQTVADVLDFVAADAASLDDAIWRDAIEIAGVRRVQPWATNSLVEAASSIAPYVLTRSATASLVHRVSQPTLLIHGTEDHLIQIHSAQWLVEERPDWTHAFIDGAGHVPMLEAPGTVLEVISTWEDAVLVR